MPTTSSQKLPIRRGSAAALSLERGMARSQRTTFNETGAARPGRACEPDAGRHIRPSEAAPRSLVHGDPGDSFGRPGGPRPWSSQRLPALKTTPRGNRVSRDLVERLDAPILGAAQCPRVADRLHPVSRGTGKRDVHLVNDALRAPTVLLATRCSYRHLSPGSSLPESKGQPIQFCLSGLPPGKDAEVDNDAPIFGERRGELIAMDRHGTGSFPVWPGDLTLGCHRRAAASRLGRDCGRVPITPATSPGLAANHLHAHPEENATGAEPRG